MVFSSVLFLFQFLPLILIVYFITPSKFKNVILLIFSLVFYAWGEPIYVLLMIFSSIVDYIHGILIDKHRGTIKAKYALMSSIIINLFLLSFFKYYDFIAVNIGNLLNINIPLLHLPLPIGISFYTFQTMSYSIDVYRGKAQVQKSPIALATYITLFPQLIAGPIVRYETIAKQINKRSHSFDRLYFGIQRFVIGLAKKVIIANQLGKAASQILIDHPIADTTSYLAWFGIIAFSFQIYFDFSGYSDMAIGLGKIFGFDFLENFNYPYISKSITEFWRRWHISLGQWFRDYIYIPLGGNKVSKIKWYRNILIVWFTTGLWHGASWNYVIWGLYFGLILVIEKRVLLKYLEGLPNFLQHLYSLLLIIIGWLIFYFENLGDALSHLKAMFGLVGVGFKITPWTSYFISEYYIFFIIAIIASLPIKKLFEKIKVMYKGLLYDILLCLYTVIIFFISISYLMFDSFNPFLYFRF